MTTIDSWDLVDKKMLELRILTNANWKNQEYELAVMGEKLLRSIEEAKAKVESARAVMAALSKAGPTAESRNTMSEISGERKLESVQH